MTRKTVDIVSFLYILLFVYASTSKLIAYEQFAVQLGQSPMLTDHANVLAWCVPVTELCIAGMLSMPKARLIGLYGALGMMVMFTTYIVIITTYDDYVPCSCGGLLESMGWSGHLIFNAVFVLLAGVAIVIAEQGAISERMTT